MDKIGLPVGLVVYAANVQARDRGPDIPKPIRHAFSRLHHVLADCAYGGPKRESALEKTGC